jgi:hypothetical protein
MISLVLAMVWARRSQALTLALLSLFAVAAAVAAPAYLRAVDLAVAAGQVRTAVADERGFEVTGLQNDRNTYELDPNAEPINFADIGTALVDLPGFDYVYAAEYPTIGIEPTVLVRSRFVYRQDVCPHVALVSGRCLIGEGEVIIGEQTARRLSLAAGDPITLTFATFSSDRRTPKFEASGAPKPLTVVGVYRPRDPGETYWGAHGYFTRDAGDRPGEPVFTNFNTMAAMDHGTTQVSIDGRARDEAMRVENLGALRTGLANLTATAGKLGQNVTIRTGIPRLLDRIDDGRVTARLIVPVVAVPLVLLACLSIYLAVGYGTEGRRPELAVVALRGARWWARWWLATGESLVAIVAGAIAGCLAGQLLVNAVAAGQFPGVGAAPGVSSLRYAPLAALAAVLAAVLAQRRQLLSPVAELLRRAPTVTAGVRALAFEGAVLVLAVVAVVQLLVTDGQLTGIGIFAPAFLALALALLAARAALPIITRFAVRALRRGRLGVALAGFQLSRRPGAARLFTLLVAAVAVAGYAACAVDVAAQGRVVASGLGNGADRVVAVETVSRAQLLTAVREIDPAGDFAMAAVQMSGGGPQEPPGLALDTSRLGQVAIWPADAPDPARLARELHPPAGAPVIFPGQDITLDVTAAGMTPNKPLRLSISLSSVTGLGEVAVQLGILADRAFTYQQRVPVCRDGCRLKGIQLSSAPGVSGITGQVIVRGLRIVNPRADAVPLAELRDVARWRVAEEGVTIAAAPDGLRIDVQAAAGLPGGAWVQPVDAPRPLPVGASDAAGLDFVTGFDGRPVPVTPVAELPAVPRIGTGAVLADLEYLDRISTDSGQSIAPQVWLSSRAPADVLDRLADAGLVVVEDVSAAQLRAQLDEQGPALGLWFYVLAGCLATALAAGALIMAAAVDRGRRVEDLSALRTQGLGRGPLSRATLWTYPVLVLAAVLAGLLIALILWQLTGWALPLAGLDPPPLPLPGRPRAPVVAGVGLAVLAVLAGVAFVTGRRTHKEIA